MKTNVTTNILTECELDVCRSPSLLLSLFKREAERLQDSDKGLAALIKVLPLSPSERLEEIQKRSKFLTM